MRISAVHLAVYEPRKRQIVKEICEAAPYVSVAVLAQTLVVEAIPA